MSARRVIDLIENIFEYVMPVRGDDRWFILLVPPMRDMVPSDFYLSQNYPDPFKGKTTIKFCVAYRTRVLLEVCDCENKIVRKLLDAEKGAGTYEMEFDACGLSPGSYIYILRAGEFVATKRMLLND